MTLFDVAIATLQAMEIQKKNNFHMSPQDKKDLNEALAYINRYFTQETTV